MPNGNDEAVQPSKKQPARAASVPPRSQPSFHSALDVAAALNIAPDPVQHDILHQNPLRCIINCCRQWGKSTITAIKTIHQAVTEPNSLILVLTPGARQSGEFLQKIKDFLLRLGITSRGDGHNELSLLLPNRSRIVGLPGNEDTTRGFSGVSLLIVDEASRVDDKLYHAVRPAIVASPNARIWILSTPNGRSGFFFRIFQEHESRRGPDDRNTDRGSNWMRVSVPAADCPRIDARVLTEERASMPDHLFRQEYCCEFLDSDSAAISSQLLDQALCDIPPLTVGIRSLCVFPEEDPARYDGAAHYFLGLDLGQSVDHSALCILERADVLISDRPDPVYFRAQTEKRYAIRHIERMPLGTAYPAIAHRVADITRHPSLAGLRTLIVDSTGLGKPFLDLLRKENPSASFYPIVITGGEHATYTQGVRHVPRNELLTALLLSIQKGILKISRKVPAAEMLLEELANLRYSDGRIDTAKTTQHDDLVFAAALANWRATQR